MRIALLSDIHGNLFALEAVLRRLVQERIDQVICLGDVAMFGPQPREVLAKLQALAWPVVMGNTDAWALNPTPHPSHDENTPIFNAIEFWGAEQLTPADHTYIQSFQPIIEVTLDDSTTLLCYHGSPHSYNDIIVASTPDADLAALIGGQQATLLAGGHTHAQYMRRYQDKILLNPGSVGLPYETLPDGTDRNPPWAEFAIIEWASGELTVTLRRIAYDTAPLLTAARASGMPHAEWWVKDWR
jgi:putative phosphoesterase